MSRQKMTPERAQAICDAADDLGVEIHPAELRDDDAVTVADEFDWERDGDLPPVGDE